jgi:hypothetical protein
MSKIRFLVSLQRLLDEGLFVASYKFALLLALADLSIEAGDDSGAALPITYRADRRKVHTVLLAANSPVCLGRGGASTPTEHREASCNFRSLLGRWRGVSGSSSLPERLYTC